MMTAAGGWETIRPGAVSSPCRARSAPPSPVGLPGRGDWTDGPVREAIGALSVKARAAGLTLGIYCASAEYARELLEEELVDYVGLGIDLVFLNTMARSAIKALRSEQWATTPTS